MDGLIYILEDDTSISGLVKVALEMNGLVVQAYSTIESFCDAVIKAQPDVALLDIMLPDGSGLEALKFVKSRYKEVACIMLSALGKEEDKVNGLNLGADDYISKPFSILELVARVNARLRNRKKQTILSVGNVQLNTETLSVSIDGQEVVLNRKEFDLLKEFMKNAGKVLSREKLLLDVWGYDVGETRTLDNHVARLRKLGVKIETVFGVGYKL